MRTRICSVKHVPQIEHRYHASSARNSKDSSYHHLCCTRHPRNIWSSLLPPFHSAMSSISLFLDPLHWRQRILHGPQYHCYSNIRLFCNFVRSGLDARHPSYIYYTRHPDEHQNQDCSRTYSCHGRHVNHLFQNIAKSSH